ncbi:toxin-antitoxin system YwqK family antitoxin [Glycomyces terrestris]|uniref:Toxin-antitoxin system YwqK family antitoxin n=1 Tax=Glycomyces terrestris TaxID=2493553 RepID=A0A426UYN6_9ACTN|nr:hypothetical protein [Glycomyces terrestris]RRR99686.1 hypothetical protein EIW28_13475 [Glycomyces terrestris]
MGQEELTDTSAMPRVPDDDLDVDGDQRFSYEGRRFTGIGFEENRGGGRDEIAYRDGYQHGPARTIAADGTVLVEDWYCKAFRHGVSRQFRPDGSLAAAVAYDGGTVVWRVAFDGGVATEQWALPSDAPEQESIAKTRTVYDLPPVPGPSAAASLGVH